MRSIAVYCGSKVGKNPRYAKEAANLGRLLASRNIRLVYGGGKVGLMGIVSEAVMAAGGKAFGVITEQLNQLEVGNTNITDLRIVDTMHKRKMLMSDESDATIILPGAVGTLDELFEWVTWTQLKIHGKPCGILNIAGYYDHLLAHLDRTIEEGFFDPKYKSLWIVGTQASVLLDRMAAWKPPHLAPEQYNLA